ncbi:MAG: glycosyl transferase, partial [Burkholderiales bacterium]
MALLTGFVVSALVWLLMNPAHRSFILVLLVCSLPAFAGGFVEDLTKRVSPAKRMLALLTAALLAALLL